MVVLFHGFTVQLLYVFLLCKKPFNHEAMRQ